MPHESDPNRAIPFRLARELTYQLEQAGESGRLAEALARPDILSALYADSSRYDVLGYWARLREEGFEPGTYFGEWVFWVQPVPRTSSSRCSRGSKRTSVPEWSVRS